MAIFYENFQRAQHGGGPLRTVNTAVSYANSNNNVAVSVYNCGPCVFSCMSSIAIRLQRSIVSSNAVFETIASRTGLRICDSTVGPNRTDQTFTNVVKTPRRLRLRYTLDGTVSTSRPFLHN